MTEQTISIPGPERKGVALDSIAAYQRLASREIFGCLFLASSNSKLSTHSVGELGLIPGSGRSPGEGNGNPLQYSCLENPMEGRSLVGYSPWGLEELDMTERLHFHFHCI